MTIKIKLINGEVKVIDFAPVVEEALKKYGFEFANMGYNPMHDRGVYRVKKGDECLGEIGLPATLTQQEVICTLKRIKEIKDSYVPRVEEIEFDL